MKVLRQKPDGRWYWHWDPKFIGRGSRREVPVGDFDTLFEVALARHRGADAARAGQAQRRRHRRGDPGVPRPDPRLEARRRERRVAHGGRATRTTRSPPPSSSSSRTTCDRSCRPESEDDDAHRSVPWRRRERSRSTRSSTPRATPRGGVRVVLAAADDGTGLDDRARGGRPRGARHRPRAPRSCRRTRAIRS